GQDMLLDSRTPATEILPLDFARSTFRFAGPAGAHSSADELQGLRIATSYENLGEDHLAEEGITAEVVHLDGAVESATRLGLADAAGAHSCAGGGRGVRIAARYEDLVQDHAAEKGITAEVVHLDGGVDAATRLGVADVIADVVETGSTLRQAGLERFGEPIIT